MKSLYIAAILLAMTGCQSVQLEPPKGYATGEGEILHEGALGRIHTQVQFFDAYDCRRYLLGAWPKFAKAGETPKCADADLSKALPWRAEIRYTATRTLKISSATKKQCEESLDLGIALTYPAGSVTELCYSTSSK